MYRNLGFKIMKSYLGQVYFLKIQLQEKAGVKTCPSILKKSNDLEMDQ